LITISPDQEANAAAMAKTGAAVTLGWHANLSEHQISDAIQSVMDSAGGRRAMSERGQKLVDGQGPVRVVELLQRSL
jgi:spore coat polysaccharide biosynthesis predicted glycosyltransferase SpsG